MSSGSDGIVHLLTAREVAEILGLRLSKDGRPPRLDRLIRRGMPKPRYQALGPRRYRRVWDKQELIAWIAKSTLADLPRDRRENLADGRALATQRTREKRDLGYWAKRVVLEVGPEALVDSIGAIHTGPLKNVQRGRGGLLRAALLSTLRRAGVADYEVPPSGSRRIRPPRGGETTANMERTA